MSIAPIPAHFRYTQCSNLSTLFPPYAPSSKKKGRDIYAPMLNETSSLVDHVFKGKLHNTQVVTKKEVIEKYREMIDQHVERRIAFFFQQLVSCYKTNLHFEMHEALNQGESPGKVTSQNNNRNILNFHRNAAHSSTLPCLIAYEGGQFQVGTHLQSQGFFFLKDTDAYRNWNATMDMPDCVNKVDILIDGTSKISKLRVNSLELLNQAALGTITPDVALTSFLNLCLSQVKKTLVSTEGNSKKAEEHQVLKYYQEDIETFLEEFTDNQTQIMELLLNLTINPNGTDEPCRKALYEIRYRAIRDSQLAQSKLMQKINTVRKEILSSYRRKPDNFNAAFQTLLIEQAQDKSDRQRMEKLYNFSPDSYQSMLCNTSKTKFNNTKVSISQGHLTKITNVALAVFNDMNILRAEELRQKAVVIKEVRKAKGWSREKLSSVVLEESPQTEISKVAISRIEKGQILITPTIVKELSAVFQLDAALLTPQFFYA